MKFAILVFPGSSCEVDVEHALTEVVGQQADVLWHTEVADLTAYDAVVVPAGAAYGDYLRPGALVKGSPAFEALKTFAASGKLVLGVGNGFQILTEAELLPGALLQNKNLKFQSGVSTLKVENVKTAFTSEYTEGESIEIPFAHQYGNYFVDEATLAAMRENDQIVFTYEGEDHGSTAKIAGVVNEAGNVFGMMPMPERAVEEILGHTDGLALFKSILKKVA